MVVREGEKGFFSVKYLKLVKHSSLKKKDSKIKFISFIHLRPPSLFLFYVLFGISLQS